MKTYKWTVLSFLTPLLLLNACVEKANDVKPQTITLPISISNIWQCHNEVAWDSIKIADKLVGQWRWLYITAGGSKPNFVDSTQNLGLVVDFKKNGVLNVLKNDTLIQTATWKVKKNFDIYFDVQTEPQIFELNGVILFCSEYVVFNESHKDAYDNYFKRK